MENGNTSKKKSKKKKIRNNSPQASNGSEKTNYFCGFSSRTVRNICEQVDSTDIQPEVYSRLAEDATYKVMELINNIKNYSKHSGGRATFDLTNEVLKDSNCMPIISADNNQEWNSIEDDHKQNIFFTNDESLDLACEFNRHITEENVTGPVFLTTSYLLDEKIDEDYMDFYYNICDSVFTGDEDCIDFALKILSESPHVAGLVKHFLVKWIDMIAVRYSNNTLDRSIRFLQAIIQNPCTGNSDMNSELKHICQLLVNLLVGSLADEHDEIRENGHDNELEPDSYSTYVSNFVSSETYNGMIDQNNGITSLDEISSDSNIKAFDDHIAVMDTFTMPASDNSKSGRSLRDELLDGFITNDSIRVKMENDDTTKDSNSSKSLEGKNDMEDDFNALLSTNCASTLKCENYHVESICELMGMCAAKWSGVEHYLTILIISEVENLFKIIKKVKSNEDFELFGRIAKAMWSIGEFAFRELLAFFDRTEFNNSEGVDHLAHHINFSAIYVRGKNDIFFYEYLYEICGDKLLPFLLYYAKFILKQNCRRLRVFEKEKNDPTKFKISPKLHFIGYRLQKSSLQPAPTQAPATFVPKRVNRPIVINYGHHPSTKKSKRIAIKAENDKHSVQQNEKLLKSFNQRIVIVKGRLKKPLTNKCKMNYFDNFHTMMF